MSEQFPIASYDQLAPAEKLVHELATRGISAALTNESAEQAMKFLTKDAHAQFKVMVPFALVEKAAEAMDSIAPLPPERALECPILQAIRCPDCRSTFVEYPQFSRKTIVGAVFPAVAAATGLITQGFYCQKCHFTWPASANERPTLGESLS